MNFEYNESNQMNFKAEEKDFITILGSNRILDFLTFKKDNNYIIFNYQVINKKNKEKFLSNIGYALIDLFDVFVSVKVSDELAFPLESKALSKSEMIKKVNEIANRFELSEVLDISPLMLTKSYKAKLLIARALITNPKVLILDNILDMLDYTDLELVKNELYNFINEGNIIINFTNNIEETTLGNKIIILDNEKILAKGSTLSILNEERLMKRLGYKMPFIVELNKYLKDYDLINKYYLDNKSLVEALWK